MITGETGGIPWMKPVLTTVACGIPMDEACRVKPLWVKLVTVTVRPSPHRRPNVQIRGFGAARAFVA